MIGSRSDAMSMSDFVARRLLGLCSAASELPATPSTSKEDHSSANDTVVKDFLTTSADYAAALQLMQLQLLCQPQIFNNFLAQVAQWNNLSKLALSVSLKQKNFSLLIDSILAN